MHIFNKRRESRVVGTAVVKTFAAGKSSSFSLPISPLFRFSALARRSRDRLVYLAPISRRAMYLWACEEDHGRFDSLPLADLVIMYLPCKRPLARNRRQRQEKGGTTFDRHRYIFFLRRSPR